MRKLRFKAYPRETVVAEKFQAMALLGIANSRMKDFYDLWTLARQFEFDGLTVSKAIGATFERRKTQLATSPPLALTTQFAVDKRKQTQWRAFLRKGRLASPAVELATVTGLLEQFLMPPAVAAQTDVSFTNHWPRGGPWQPNSEGSR